MAPFFSAVRYMIGPLFSTKSIWMTRFFWITMWKGPIFLTSWYMHILFAQNFFEATCSSIQYFVIFVKQPAINEYKKIKGQYMNRSAFWMIKYMNWFRFQRPGIWMGRFWNTGSYTHTKITPQLPLRPPPPPAPPPPLPHTHTHPAENLGRDRKDFVTNQRNRIQKSAGNRKRQTHHLRSASTGSTSFYTHSQMDTLICWEDVRGKE